MTVDPAPGSAPDAADEDVPAGPPPAGVPERTAGEPALPDSAMIAHPLAMLAGTMDRERAIDVLKAGFAEGRLTQAEHDERVTKVYAARTYGDLAPLVADLPAGPVGIVVSYPAAGSPPSTMPVRPMTNSLAMASLICGLFELPTLGITALPAVILGTRARQQIRETGERGEGLAVAGLILGWTAIALFSAAVVGLMIWLALPAGPGTGGPIGG